ncbi:MAG: glucose-6-phosphate dehydrogenase [Bellilinea sp.]
MAQENSVTETDAPLAIVIFGVTGDLTHRKLIPAIYSLTVGGKLPKDFHIVGFARREWTDEAMREDFSTGIEESLHPDQPDALVLNKILQNSYYVQSTFEDPVGYAQLCDKLDALKVKNVLFYLATPPEVYPTIVENIRANGINHRKSGWTRIIVEKPYGRDLDSAIELDNTIHQVFEENQIYRIDHYLGKETVQNILVFRFANAIFEPLWNRRYVDHIQINVAETVGVGTRAGYYDTSGVIRDMFQNHLLQLVTLTAMEAPVNFNADAVRDEKVKVLKALRPIREMEAITHTFRAQYVSGVIEGVRVPGYKEEEGVPANSITETMLAVRLCVDNWRWAGVPFYVRSSKRMPKRKTEIIIRFRQAPLSLFNWVNLAGDAPNTLILNLQPNEGIRLEFGAKAPGPAREVSPVIMKFDYDETFGSDPPEAYQRLLLDSIQGDATLFTRQDEVRSQWAFTTDILKGWEANPVTNLPVYEAGTWGPPGLDEFIQKNGFSWR